MVSLQTVRSMVRVHPLTAKILEIIEITILQDIGSFFISQ
jgi:hypothetical protein